MEWPIVPFGPTQMRAQYKDGRGGKVADCAGKRRPHRRQKEEYKRHKLWHPKGPKCGDRGWPVCWCLRAIGEWRKGQKGKGWRRGQGMRAMRRLRRIKNAQVCMFRTAEIVVKLELMGNISTFIEFANSSQFTFT